MFTLLSGLWKWLFQKDEFCILIVGLDNAGKTTFLEHAKRKYAIKNYKGIPFEKIGPTVGMNVGHIHIKSEILLLWDLGGQEELQTLWNKYFMDCHGVIYMIDSSDAQRLEDSYKCFDTLISDEDLVGIPMLVLANKQDKPNSITAEAVKEIFNRSSNKLGKRDCMLHEISALDGSGIEEGLQWMLERVKRNIFHRPPREKEIT
ncbi:ADP-ribosylation factor-related protein 1-like [Hydractinia symbiolongicarpus]|uniref:ADP-ribosylation factor-related protein 1-like n=1 Tax=Hydractinia symbiolongicarpus TaxID=13093 RepID=UPI002550510E|nr:ADP-ribosylation factor-related protein 1-like [Hydractinia symbiolongicarpus]XP_057315739.1 ADP-ribosylation factor-related protein 1-like [Hydractinia symbiolongicarpus]XP_057315740.1 ADP-ribosylation factor-related protein 1-like [Hydractinia symbiolongicarpus]